MSTPETTIYLCSGVRLNSRYDHSIHFADKSAQQEYFSGKVVKTLPAYSFIRRSWALKVESELSEAVKWNYLYFRYPNDNKYYYYFINKVEYVNDSTVELTLELDLLQTYLFDVSFAECLIEREHVTDDSFGKHTVSEGLDAGELQYTQIRRTTELEDYVILILSSFNPYTTTSSANANTSGGVYSGVYSGVGLYAVPLTKWGKLSNKIADLTEAGLIDGIVSMWMYPKALVRLDGNQSWDDDDMWCFNVGSSSSTGIAVVSHNHTPSDTIKGYTPKNKKLFIYPYNAIEVSNNSGSTVTYRLEHFNNFNLGDGIKFKVYGGMSPDAGMRLIPEGYLNGDTISGNNQAINAPAFPTCAWNSDTYKIWLAQNQHNLDTQRASSAVGAVAGIAGIVGGVAMIASGAGTPVGIGMIGGGVTSLAHSGIQIANSIGTQEAAEKQADQMRGSFAPSVTSAMGMMTFTICQRQLTPERAKIIDDYFTVYGYKVNRIDTPSRHNRASFTYVKTIGCHAYGDITNEDIAKIEAIYDHGVTWWVDGDTIGNYSLDNSTL